MPAEIQPASGWSARTAAATSCSPANARAGSAPSGATAITPRRSRCVVARHGVGQLARLRRAHPAASRALGVVLEVDLHQRLQPSTGRLGAAVERRHELGPVDRVHRVGVTGHRAGLAALHLPDEVHVQGPAGLGAQGGELGRGLLVAALPHVGHAELGQQLEVADREELGDDHQPDTGGVASGVGAGRGDAVLHLGQPGGQLAPTATVGGVAHAVAPLGQQPHDAGEAAGLPVATVGVQVRGLPGAARHPAHRHVVRLELVDHAARDVDGRGPGPGDGRGHAG